MASLDQDQHTGSKIHPNRQVQILIVFHEPVCFKSALPQPNFSAPKQMSRRQNLLGPATSGGQRTNQPKKPSTPDQGA
jgi:hypothetical protein